MKIACGIKIDILTLNLKAFYLIYLIFVVLIAQTV